MRDKRVYLRHILACIADIEAFTEVGYEAFDKSRLHQAAVMRARKSARDILGVVAGKRQLREG